MNHIGFFFTLQILVVRGVQIDDEPVCTLESCGNEADAINHTTISSSSSLNCMFEGYDKLHWGEQSKECITYWESDGMTMEAWDEDSFWHELDPASQQYWLDSDRSEDEWDTELFSWEELPSFRRHHYQMQGWNKAAWDSGDESLKVLNEEALDWEELPADRLQYWTERGFTKEMWENGENLSGLNKIGNVFNPIKLKISIPELEAITIDALAGYDTYVGLRDGNTTQDNESFIGKMHIKDYIPELRKGTTKYLAMEDIDPYKKAFEEAVGGSVYKYLFDALNGSDLQKRKLFTPEKWDSQFYDWAMFAGSKGTSTSMHYDNDLFNFLWVSEGRKRIVLIPNDDRTAGKFDITSAFSGTAHTGIDILNKDMPLPEFAVEIEIGAGEGIYFPYMCWHAIKNLEDTLAFGWRLKDGY